MAGPMEKILMEKLSGILTPSHLEIVNESPSHGLPASAEKHFRVTIVSEHFGPRSRVERHRRVHQILAEEMRESIHALALHTYTPQEWRARQGQSPDSPACLGGGKQEGRF